MMAWPHTCCPKWSPLSLLELSTFLKAVLTDACWIKQANRDSTRPGGWAPMFFNIFINEIFLFCRDVKFYAYADDHQIYLSHSDPVALDGRMHNTVETANWWYRQNGMLANESKHRALGKIGTYLLISSKGLNGLNILSMNQHFNIQ